MDFREKFKWNFQRIKWNSFKFKWILDARFKFKRNHVQIKYESTGIKYCYIWAGIVYDVHVNWFIGKKSCRILISWLRGSFTCTLKLRETTHELHVPFYLIFRFILVVFYSNCLITKIFNLLFFLWKIALLDSTFLRKFKIFQPEEH